MGRGDEVHTGVIEVTYLYLIKKINMTLGRREGFFLLILRMPAPLEGSKDYPDLVPKEKNLAKKIASNYSLHSKKKKSRFLA